MEDNFNSIDFSEFAGSGGSYDPNTRTPAQIAAEIAESTRAKKAEFERAKNINWSDYAGLRDLWDRHPSNTQGAYSRGYRPAEGEASQVLRDYTVLTQQLSDDLGGQNTLEALMALGGIGAGGIDPEAAQQMMNRAGRRKSYLAEPNRNHQAFETSGYRGAAVFAGDREANLDFIKANRLANLANQFGTPEEINFYRKLADQEELKGTKFYETGGRGGLPTQEERQKFNWISQYGTPDQIEYTNQLATQLRSAQPQGMLSQLAQSSQPIDMYSTTSKYFQPELQNIQLSNTKKYLQSLDNTGYLSLLSKMLGR
jgi:hypothetical protein